MATNPILSASPLANLMVRKITIKARMKSACPQNVAFRFIEFLIDERPEKHITLSFGALARGLKSERSESAHVLASQRPKGVPTAFCYTHINRDACEYA